MIVEKITNDFEPIKSYQQYSKLSWYKDYIKCVNKLRKELYIDYMDKFIEAINIQTSESQYLAYYIQYVFGLYKPLGASSVNTFYDIGERYDSLTPNNNPIIYDDSEEYNGKISFRNYLILLQFVLNYGEEVINQPMLIDFLCKICKLQPTEIKIEFPDVETISFILPNTSDTQDFLKTTINYWDWLGLPFGVKLDFVIKE